VAIAYVQDLGSIVADGVASSASTFASTPTAGNAITVGVAGWVSGNTTWTPSAADNKGNTYNIDITKREATTLVAVARQWSALNIASSATFTVTLTPSTGTFYVVWTAHEFSGVAKSSAVDQTGSNANSGAASLTVTTTGNLSSNDDLVVSVVALDTSLNHTSFSAAGYTDLEEANGSLHMVGAIGRKILTGGSGATQSAAWTWTTNPSIGAAATIVAYKPLATGISVFYLKA
jgi:hypothetical protein